MKSNLAKRGVVVAGVGLHSFGRFPKKSTAEMVQHAVQAALEDSGLSYADVEVAYYAHVYYQGASPGERFLEAFGLTGIPILNVENACSSGTTGIWQAYWAIATGQFDCALVVGSERVPKGPVSITEEGDPQRFIGDDHMMAQYALKTRRYMNQHGATLDAIAQVAVKAHKNAANNPHAQYNKEFTLADVLESRVIAEPLTLYQCCPTSEGAAATVLVSEDAFNRKANGRSKVYLRTVALATSRFRSADVLNPDQTQIASQQAYHNSGIAPKDINVVQVHDAATIGEILQLELLGLIPEGQGWVATKEGRTAITGDLPVNTDGGLQAMGHPFGASGVRMLHEIVTQLRGNAGVRQAKSPKTGLIQCSGAGGVSTVAIVSR